MTIDHLYLHALERPEDLALIDGERKISYAEFQRDLKKFTRAIQQFGAVRGSSIAIGCDDFYTHWLLILACEYLGITSASFGAKEGGACRTLLGSVDLVLAEPHYPPGGWNTRAITPAWLRSIQDGPDDPLPPAVRWQPEEAVRIVRTSGTTGDAKRLNMTHGMVVARLHQYTWLYRNRPTGSGSLLTLPFSISATYRSASVALANGWTVVVGNNVPTAALPELIRRHRLSALTVLPVQLKHLLDCLPPDWVKPQGLETTSFGASVSDELRRAAAERLADRVNDVYASNEAGVISVARQAGSGGFGVIFPGVEVEIVDEDDLLLPDGEAGQIRVRGDALFRGYADDQTLTRRMLRGGWFYPGDLGIRDGRRLQVIGRTGDQVNLGGVKYPLSWIESTAQSSGGAGVKDVGAVPLPSAAGLDEIHIALVTDGSDDRAVLDRIIAALRPVLAGGLHFIRLPEIPRNDMGKIDRTKLKEAILAIHAETARADSNR